MRSRRTGSRSIRALPPTLPPAISTCARRYVESEYYENRAGNNGAGRHHDHRPVGQPELFLPARSNVSSGRRKQGRRGEFLEVEPLALQHLAVQLEKPRRQVAALAEHGRHVVLAYA